MSANECPKHTAFFNACTTFSNTHVIKHLAAKFGLDAQMQCNKLDANKPHKLFAEELLVFIFGQPDKPFIRCVLPFGFKLPGIKEGESRYQQRQGVYHLVDQEGNFERKTDKDEQLECLNQRIKVLENRLAEINGDHTETVKGHKVTTAKYITENASTIKMNSDTGVCTGATICPFTGKPHVDVSKTVFAGK
ncbi:phage regulatory CII family protein [Photobacterium lutimaris]|uniref:Uncharacterized protein n=1 Tax=Photobacterium lutimaris TaxID=388278 RepID=A0A2T3J1Q5_9GAMM|nr:phage regulatory CII family protein [Photobacterium lutimaris]PSU34980.1 hypothetical protein C9I99_07890 [Photobacterium lutimaris]TDR77335.1 phage regulatory protein CII [Photobacterium lutimaris]